MKWDVDATCCFSAGCPAISRSITELLSFYLPLQFLGCRTSSKGARKLTDEIDALVKRSSFMWNVWKIWKSGVRRIKVGIHKYSDDELKQLDANLQDCAVWFLCRIFFGFAFSWTKLCFRIFFCFFEILVSEYLLKTSRNVILRCARLCVWTSI